MSERKPPAPAAASNYTLPAFAIPDLPTSSGAWFGTRTHILEQDATFVRAHADYLTARAEQTDALRELLVARMRVARLMAELVSLPETCRRERDHAMRMLTLQNEAEATEAAIVLAEARSRLSHTLGGNASTSTDGSLSIDDVETTLSQFPEIDADNIGKISILLRALAREKKA